MKRYRLHDLLRAGALAWVTGGCAQTATAIATGGQNVGADATLDAQIEQDTDFDTLKAPPDVAPFVFACADSTPVLMQGQATGFATCANGLVHRTDVHECPTYQPDPAKLCTVKGTCEKDADCAGMKNGHCDPVLDEPCACQSSCKNDADCAPGEICQCGPKFGRCAKADCALDSDCPTGMVCGFFVDSPGCDFPAFGCQTPGDTCATAADCGAKEECTWDKKHGHRFCETDICAAGRPFAVDGDWRTADLTTRGDWIQPTLSETARGLGDETRHLLAQYWLDAARMEHASVASFARLTLELMAVGAPPDLLTRAQQAGLDEVRHAQACFGLAALFGAPEFGPGHLAIDASLRQPDLVAIAAAAAREGCIWETVAALEARVAASTCLIPAVRDVLEIIADDEADHADLAWEIVRWAMQTGGGPVRAAVEVALAEGIADVALRPCGKDMPEGLGVLGGQNRGKLRAHAVATVIQPARRRLLRDS